MISISPIRALDSGPESAPQTARLFRLKPFKDTIRLVEQPPPTEAQKPPPRQQQQVQARSPSSMRAQAVRLMSSVRSVVRTRLLGGRSCPHLWAWLLVFIILTLALLVMCARLQSSVHTIERRFEVLLGLVSHVGV